MKTLIRFGDWLDRAVSYIGQISGWLFLLLMLIIIFDVATRKFFVMGSTKLQEMEWHVHTALFVLVLGYAYVKDIHVRIDLVHSKLGSRSQSWIEVLGIIFLLLPFIGVLLYFSIDFFLASYVIDEVSSAGTGLTHRWIIKAFIPFGLILMLLSGLARLLREVVWLFGPGGRSAKQYDPIE